MFQLFDLKKKQHRTRKENFCKVLGTLIYEYVFRFFYINKIPNKNTVRVPKTLYRSFYEGIRIKRS